MTLSSGQPSAGCFFLASSSTRHDGPERVADLLNSEHGFFPFEIHGEDGVRTVLYHRSHVVFVGVAEEEATLDPGYGVATRRIVSVLLSNGQRITGAVRVYRPEGRDRAERLDAPARNVPLHRDRRRTLVVNFAHIVEVSEVAEP